MSFAKSFILFLSLAASATALATPYVVRQAHHHHAIAARVAAPAPLDVPVLAFKKRQNSKRCKQRSSSIQGATPTPVSSSAVDAPSSTPRPAPATTKKATTTPPPTTTHDAPPPPPPAPTTKKSSGAPSGGANLPSFMVGTQTGQGTFYATGLGACGITNNDGQHIAAVSHLLFDKFPGYNGGNPNNNPICGRTVTATYQGKSVQVALTDRCEACDTTDLDFSPSAFNSIADPAVGRISGMTWTWD